jgi:hypothetical protein
MTSLLCALFACESGRSELEIELELAGARVRSFDLAKARQMAKFARRPVCKNNCKLL